MGFYTHTSMAGLGRVWTLSSHRAAEAPRPAAVGQKRPVVSHDLNGCFYPASLTLKLSRCRATNVTTK